MYSGTDNVDYPTQWALNPSTYQNMANDQVDWGALAQQWIQMKETCPPASLPAAPPAPVISVPVGEEGGEAPMDVEGNDVEAQAAPVIPSQQWRSGSSNWGNSWDQWGGNGQGNWDWETNSNNKTSQNTADPPYTSGYSTSGANYSGFNNSSQQNYRPGYWSTDEANDNSTTNVHSTESTAGRGSRRVPRHHAPSPPHVSVSNVDTTQTIDAAKRRQLPGWIREGLEKMEREKQKQVDRERERREREEYLKQKMISDELISQESKEDDVPKPPAKSKFETDSEDSDHEQNKKKTAKITPSSRDRVAVPPPLLLRTPEEIMQDTMLIVRRTLTEILLEVTNEQIMSICQEELSRKRLQPQASRGTSVASKTQALSSIGGQLGLGIYGDSSGESDTEADSEDGKRSSTPSEKRKKMCDMTDAQLQESIKRRKAEFEKTTREIEAQLLSDENNLKTQRNDGTSANDEKSHRHTGERFHNAGSDGEESTTNVRNEGNVNRQRKYSTERTPPLDGAKKSSYNEGHKKQSKKSKHSSREKSRRDKTEKGDAKKKSRNHSSSRSASESSESESDSHKKRSDNSNDKRSNSSRSASTSSASNSSYTSESSRSNKKKSKKAKKSSSSEDSLISKKSKNERRSDKYNKKGKSADKKYDYDYRRESRRDSQSSNRKSGTPERRSAHKSKYTERSRSRSYDRNNVYDNHGKYYSSTSRHRSRERRDRSRDRHDRWDDKNEKSRDDRNRMKDGERSKDNNRDTYKDNCNRSRERRDKSSERRDRDRDKRKDREYKDNRSSRY